MVTHPHISPRGNPARASVPAVLGAMLLWGSWCFVANAGVALPARLGMGLAQALASGAVTWGLARAVAFAMARIGGRSGARWLVPLGVVTVTGSALWLLHWRLETPALAQTIAPPIAVAWSYCQWLTWKASRRRPSPAKANDAERQAS